jgi:predicted P-loop ATPase
MSNNNNSIGNHTSTYSILSESSQSCQESPKLTQTYSISKKHWLEWCEGSGVSEEITRLAITSLNDRKVIKQRIGWKGYPDCNPLGWFVDGLDLRTMQRQAFGQFKPDKAIQLPDEEKPTKYITDKGHPYDAIALPHPDKDFWQRVLDDVSIPVDLDEGAKKSGAGMTCGFPSLALPGVTMWQRKGELVSNLAAVAVPGRIIRIRFDMDLITKKEVRLEVKKLVKALEQRGCTVLVAMWDKELGEKIDDVKAKHGPEMVKEIMADAMPYPVWIKSLEAQFGNLGEPPDTGGDKPKNKSKNKLLLDWVETHWGERLRLNEMTQQIELNGKAGELDVERAYLRLASELGIDIPKQTASDLVAVIAQKYAYSPVRDYLNSLTGFNPIDLDSLAERYFGTSNPLHATLLKRTLIAAVARVFKPGCKVDTLCILQGGQGVLKSTFWQTLASESWFTDNLSEANEKDEKLKLRRYWILEFSEFETAYKRKEVEQLKAFLSSRIDSLRRPYGRTIEDFPRTSVFVGSTNRQEFLHDPTGERRYWVIPVLKSIPVKTVEEERDRIWATAVAAYKSGQQWWLTPEEDELLAEANQGWQSSDTWEVPILKYLETRSTCTVGELLEKVIGLDLAQNKKGDEMRVSDILRRNGWLKASKRIDGKLQRCWEKQVVTGGNEVVTEVVTPQNPCPVTISDTLLPPVTTFSSKKPSNINNNSEATKNNSQSEKTFENRGGNSSSIDPKNVTRQALEPVTTSPQQGGNSPKTPHPQCPEMMANEYQAKILADEMRKAITKTNRKDAAEVIKQVANSDPKVRQSFFKSFTKEENLNIRLLRDCGLTKGTRVEYVGKDIDQYAGEVLTVESINARNELACLRPDGKGFTTWLKPEDLRKL